MTHILITGATGFVGQNLVRQFQSVASYEITCIVRDIQKAKGLFAGKVNLVSSSELYLLKTLKVDVVLHMASLLISKDDEGIIESMIDANITFGVKLMNALRDKKGVKFINLGSFAEYRHGAGVPNCAYLYSATKQAFRPLLTYYASISNWDFIHLVPYTIYGGLNNQKKLIDFVRASLDAEEPIPMSPGHQVSDFIHVNDVIDCIRFFIDNQDRWQGQKGEEYHLGTGRGTSIRELASMFEKLTGKKCNIQWGGRAYRERDVMHAVAPIGKLLDLGWKARIRLEEGIVDNLVLGVGIAGLGALYKLKQSDSVSEGLEKEDTYGGLCDSFTINGFTFDRFIHLSFSSMEEVNKLFKKVDCGYLTHVPKPSNVYKGKWIKHPAQNNLYALEEDERETIINDFKRRPLSEEVNPKNYEDWLRLQFGDYFAEHFPMVYTRKYWMKEASELRTEWVGQRVYQPSLEEVIAGSKREDNRITYYAKEMRYPKKGGYKRFLKVLADNANIEYNSEVIAIDTIKHEVHTRDGIVHPYSRLISSLPLPEMVKIVKNTPIEVVEAASKLECTCGYHVSIALKTKHIPPYLWWYIYDEDNLSARVHSPSTKSPDNAPEGCSSLQMEVYCKEGEYSEQEIKQRTVGKLIEKGFIKEEDILFVHLGYEKYANVIFTEPIYEARKIVRDYLASVGIETIGRFGEWDYLWSDQSLMSGLSIG